MAETSRIVRQATSSGRTSMRSPMRERITSFARASKPSTSSVGSASAYPRSCAWRSVASNSAPSSMLLRMKLQVPFKMPWRRLMRSPASPCCTAGITGTPPATAAPYSSWQPCRRANSSSAGPCSAIIFLLAVTTDLPAASDRRTQSPAGFSPPANSTTMSGLDARTSSKFSVQSTEEGIQGTRLRSIPRLKMQPSATPCGGCSHRIRAADVPTVPKPKMATFTGAPAPTLFLSIDTTFSQIRTELEQNPQCCLQQKDRQTGFFRKKNPTSSICRTEYTYAGSALEVTELLFGHGLAHRSGRFPFERAAYQVARTQTHCERQRQNDAAKENAEGQIHNRSSDRQVIEHHRDRKHQHQPLDAQAQQPRIVEVHVHCANEHAAGKKARHHVAQDEQHHRTHDVGNVTE